MSVRFSFPISLSSTLATYMTFLAVIRWKSWTSAISSAPKPRERAGLPASSAFLMGLQDRHHRYGFLVSPRAGCLFEG